MLEITSTDGVTVRARYTESQAQTHAFVRVIGPWLVIVPGIIVLRVSEMGALASEFFKSALFVWFSGALLLFGGLLIIAFHQYWSNAAAVLISLFDWILALRGLGAHGSSRTVRTRCYVDGRDTCCPAHLRCPHRDLALPHLCGLAHQACFAIGKDPNCR
jgi:hypothetical protein